MWEKGELSVVPKWQEDKCWIIIPIISASSGQPRGLEQSEEMVIVPFTSLGSPGIAPSMPVGFLVCRSSSPKPYDTFP